MTKTNRLFAIIAAAATLPLMACSGAHTSAELPDVTHIQQTQVELTSLKSAVSETEGPVWYVNALKYLGTAEKKGDGKSNHVIEKMHNLTKNARGYSDATPWCASFVNFILRTTAEEFGLPDGYKGTGSAGARHIQDPANYSKSKSNKQYPGWGVKVAVSDLHVGDVISIIWNGTTKGHAGFVAATYVDDKGKITGVWVLGGNQSNAKGKTETVNVALYMLDEAKRIAFKRPVGYNAAPAHKAVPLSKAEAAVKFSQHIGKRGSLASSR